MDGRQLFPGENIALKIPRYKYLETRRFYEEVLRLPIKAVYEDTVSYAFGKVTLWLDRVDNYSQADIWLELYSTEEDLSQQYLADHAVPRRDELEPQQEGYFISDPAGIIFRVGRPDPAT